MQEWSSILFYFLSNSIVANNSTRFELHTHMYIMRYLYQLSEAHRTKMKFQTTKQLNKCNK
jgi:hypothetical protein